MTTATAARCPGCLRERLPRHPSGMTWNHGLACPLLAAEDATRAADVEQLAQGGIRIERPATDTERTLLAACGWTVPDGTTTTVCRLTPGVLRRTWTGVDIDATPPPITTSVTA